MDMPAINKGILIVFQGEKDSTQDVILNAMESLGNGDGCVLESLITDRDLFGAAVISGVPVSSSNTSAGNSDDEDDKLAVTELGKHAQTREYNTFKTTGDVDFTAWQVLQLELSILVVVH
jgi:hypothetical protein